jgi:hypothetical protein
VGRKFGAVALGVVALGLLCSASADAEVEAGCILIAPCGSWYEFYGGVGPTALPKYRPRPIGLTIGLRSTPGANPPGLQRAEFELSSFAQLEPQGYSRCPIEKLRGLRTVAVVRRCRSAIVGEGFAQLDSEPGAPRTTESLTLLNSPLKRQPRMVAIGGAERQAVTPFLIPIELRRLPSGPYSVGGVVEIPRITGGFGKVIGLSLAFGYGRGDRGRRQYLVGRCQGHFPSFLRLRMGYVLENSESFRYALRPQLCSHPGR